MIRKYTIEFKGKDGIQSEIVLAEDKIEAMKLFRIDNIDGNVLSVIELGFVCEECG